MSIKWIDNVNAIYFNIQNKTCCFSVRTLQTSLDTWRFGYLDYTTYA